MGEAVCRLGLRYSHVRWVAVAVCLGLFACSTKGGVNSNQGNLDAVGGVDQGADSEGKVDSPTPTPTDSGGTNQPNPNDSGGVDQPPSADPLAGLLKTYNTTCNITGEPTDPPLLTTTQVLKGLQVSKPVQFVSPRDGTGRIFVVGQTGTVHVVDEINEFGGGDLWLDIRDQVDDDPNEGGLLGLAFPDDFASSGVFFVYYTRTEGWQFQGVVSLFQVSDPANGTPDLFTEQVLLTVDQPYSNHNGGGLEFGPDGMLYLAVGDGGAGGDPLGHGQNLGTLLATILRIDVSSSVATGTYTIPPDNPFVSTPGARGEIWAYGLRNVWRFSFDSVGGALWAGDVGQDKWEEVDIVEKGGNYGWNIMESAHCYSPAWGCEQEGLILPVAEYPQPDNFGVSGWDPADVGKSITGGYVYRGSAMPLLYGTYIFGDFANGKIWGLSPDEEGEWAMKRLAETGLYLSSFGVDEDQELYALDWYYGRVFRLEQAGQGAVGAPGWPATLSETGCFADVPNRILADGIFSYDVNMPLWSDGAGKERAVALPDGTLIEYHDDGAWGLPDGAIIIKTFVLNGMALETRFLVRDGEDWRGATYQWNEEGTEAHLLIGSATAEAGGQTWYFPSRADCKSCHTKASGQVLGLRTPQMNRAHNVFGTGDVNQIHALSTLGYFSVNPTDDPASLVAFPDLGDASAPLERRARAYLDVNCANCHQPNTEALGNLDLRIATALSATGTCDEEPEEGNVGVWDARILKPGVPDKSTLWLRINSADPDWRMPAIATQEVHSEAVAIIGEWITSLTGCQ